MANENWLEGKWHEFKGEMRKMWGNITDDDLEKTKGNMTSIRGLVQQKYGTAEETWGQKFDDLAGKFKKSAADASEGVKESLRDSEREDEAEAAATTPKH